MKWYEWKWWRLAKGFSSGGMTGDGHGIWIPIFNTKFKWLSEKGRKFCSNCSRTVPFPDDPYERPLCGHCQDV